MIEVADVSVAVPGRVLIQGASFQVAAGESVAILGSSGSGKTTLLNCMSGLRVPDSGRISIDGNEISSLSPRRRAEFRLARIGMVFQFGELMPELSALENVALPERLAGGNVDGAARKAAELLEKLGISHLSGTRPEAMSGGEQQRVGVARALVRDPAVIVADEPTGMLDEDSSQVVVSLIAEVARTFGTAVVLATHDLSVARAMTRTFRVQGQALVPQTVESAS